MLNKQVHKYTDIRGEILKAVDMVCDPIRQTMSPKGLNVIFEGQDTNFYSTNDGATIIKNLTFKNSIHNAICEIIKSASLRTNVEAGDGTSTTVLLAGILTKEAFKLIDGGMNAMDVKREFEKFAQIITAELKKKAIKVRDDKDLERIAYISANNDGQIAKDVVRTIKVAGLDGMVFIEPHSKTETEIIEDSGFIIESGMFSPEFRTQKDRFVSAMLNPVVFITDKRLYYAEEAETILSTALLAGHKNIVIVARDFIGQSVNVFLANHGKDCNILLIKDNQATDKDASTLEDLAAYLGGKVVSEKHGSLVNNITIDDFVVAAKTFSDNRKTVLSSNKPNNKQVKEQVKAIRQELEKDKDDRGLKKRLASLTNGMVTIKVGAHSVIEMNEKIYRYEDAVNAVRAAMRDGYLVGGGVSLFRAYNPTQHPSEFHAIYKKFCLGNIRQIAENCGKHADSIIEQITSTSNSNVGYNAAADKIEDLLKAGVVDPLKVTENAVNNAISIVGQIISSNFIIVNEVEEKDE
jgi:chaperonin GroEL